MRKTVVRPDGTPSLVRLSHVLSVNIKCCYDHKIDVNKFKHLWQLRILMRYDMEVFLLTGLKNKQTKIKQTNKEM